MFSEREKKILKIIGNKRVTLKEIAYKLYGDDMKYDSNIGVANAVNRIRAKTELNRLNWTIASEGLGRRGKTVWKKLL